MIRTLARPPSAADSPARAPAGPTCDHCGLDVPKHLLARGASVRQFCCAGCKAAYQVIHEGGLERYYELRARALDDGERPADLEPPNGASTGTGTFGGAIAGARDFAVFDDAGFLSLYATRADGSALGADCGPACGPVTLDRGAKGASGTSGDGTLRIDLMLEGVHCTACVWLIEKLPRLVPGVVEARLDYGRAVASVTWEPARVKLSRIARTLATLGYTPHAARSAPEGAARTRSDRAMLARVGIAGALAANVMLIFLALYAGALSDMEPWVGKLLREVSMGLSVLSLLWPGRVFLASGWAALRTRTAHLDVPIALGLSLGVAWGVFNTLRGAGEIYFDSISVLIFFLLVGRYVQQRQQRWAADSVGLLFNLTPATSVLVETSGVTREVPTRSILVGQCVEVRSGASVPVDGVVESGQSAVDRSLLSGESRPVSVGVGDEVHAGTVNVGATLRIRASATGETTRLGRMMKLVEEGSRARAPIVLLADRAGVWFLWLIGALALITLVVWWPAGPARAIEYAVALVVVTCPCGLGLATPMVMTLALGRAARAGLLVKSAAAVEQLARGGTILLDKTGTLTLGQTRVTRWTPALHAGPGALRLAASVAAQSDHHAARALVSFVGSEHVDATELDGPNNPTSIRATTGPIVSDACEELGRGVRGTIGGVCVRIGTRAFACQAVNPRASVSPELADAHNNATHDGLSPLWISLDGVPAGVLAVGDVIRPEAAQAVAQLRQMGWSPRIISGDDPGVVRAIASAAGIDSADAQGGLSPEGKLLAVQVARAAEVTSAARSRHAPGAVVMVGDGVNDAPALACASVGIAVKGGAEASLAAADAYLRRDGLWPVVELVRGSRRTLRAVHLTFATSIAYNAVAAGLCVAGLIDPLLAAVIMPASSFTVLAIAVLYPTFKSVRAGRPHATSSAAGGSRIDQGALR